MAYRSIAKIAATSCVVLSALALAFVAGVHTGATESAWLQSTAKGSILVGELRALRAGSIPGLIRLKELELDGEVLYYHRLESQGHPWLFWPDSGNFEHERYLRQIAAYRKEFPAVMPTLEVAGSDQVSDEIRRNNKQVGETTKAIVDRYAK